MRTRWISATGLVAVAMVAGASRADDGERPNVVLIMTDNHGAWTLGCYGNPEIRTPRIDRLARLLVGIVVFDVIAAAGGNRQTGKRDRHDSRPRARNSIELHAIHRNLPLSARSAHDQRLARPTQPAIRGGS